MTNSGFFGIISILRFRQERGDGANSSVGRVPDCDSGCRGFESHFAPQNFETSWWKHHGVFFYARKKNGYEGDAFTLHDESQTLSFMKKKAWPAGDPSKKTEILIFLSFPRGKQEPWGRVGGSTMFLVPSFFFSLRAGMILTHQNLSFLRLLDWRAGVSGVLPDSADFFVPLLSPKLPG